MNVPAPSVGTADRIRNPAVPGEHLPKRVVLFALAAVLVAGVAGGGVWLLASGGEEAKPRLLSLKTGPLSAMPDLRDGVPALVQSPSSPGDQRGITRALAKGEGVPAVTDEAGRKAMEATLASAGLRPAIVSGRTVRPESGEPARTDLPPGVEPTRSVRPVTGPGAAASLAPSPPATRPEPDASIRAPAPPARPAVEASRATAPTEARRDAPTDAPLPPRRPVLPAGEVVSTPAQPVASPRPATAERTPPARTRDAASRPAAAEAQPARPRRVAEAEEERSVLGVPVPGFIPTGRDISNAASSISNAVTGLAGF